MSATRDGKSNPNPAPQGDDPKPGATSPEGAGNDDDDDDDDDDAYAGLSKAELLSQIRKKDRRNLKLLSRAKDAEEKADEVARQLQELESKGLPEAEKVAKQVPILEKRIADLETERDELAARLREERIERQVEKVAVAQGFRDPEDALAYLPIDDLEVDEETGEVERASVEKALKLVAKAKPYLLQPADEGGDTPPQDVPSSPSPNGEGRSADKDEEARLSQRRRFARRI